MPLQFRETFPSCRTVIRLLLDETEMDALRFQQRRIMKMLQEW